MSARSLQQPQPAGRGGAEGEEGIQSPEGPPGRGDLSPHRSGANQAETEPPGKARGAAGPALTPDRGLPGTMGRRRGGAGTGRGSVGAQLGGGNTGTSL